MADFQQRLRLAKIVLQNLSMQPESRIGLEKQLIRKGGTPATFNSIFFFLIQDGYVQKGSSEHRAPYLITDKGKSFLEVLTWS